MQTEQGREDSRAASPREWPCKQRASLGGKTPMNQSRPAPEQAVLTRQGPRSSSSTAAGWCDVESPTPAGQGCRTAPS